MLTKPHNRRSDEREAPVISDRARKGKERSIILSGWEARGLHEGRISLLWRRMPQPKYAPWTGYMWVAEKGYAIECGQDYPDDEKDIVRCPFGSPGDRLLGKETICQHRHFGLPLGAMPQRNALDEMVWSYAADNIEPDTVTGRRPPGTMSRWAVRTVLEITEVQARPLQSITEYEVEQSGVPVSHYYCEEPTTELEGVHRCDPIARFTEHWDSHHKPGQRWANNPWCWMLRVQAVLSPREGRQSRAYTAATTSEEAEPQSERS